MNRLARETKFLRINYFSHRNFVAKTRNLYDVLQITPAATHTEIKAAYYKLSKQYHPDRNSNEEAAEMFKLINEAYEVLSNYRLKKLYDKGIIHTAGHEYRHHARPSMREQPYAEDDFHDDASTKFYKSRLKREHTGKSKIYDFDEWTQQHYGEAFKKRMETKKRHTFYKERDVFAKKQQQSNSVSIGLIIGILVVGFLAEFHTRFSSQDKVTKKESNESGE